MNSKITRQKELLPVGGLFALLTRNYYGVLSQRLGDIGIERHYTALHVIDSTADKCTQQYLSDLLEVDKVSMVRMLDYLAEKGMIERKVNPADRREHLIVTTRKGKKVAAVIGAAIRKLNNTAFRGLTEKEQDLLADLLVRIMSNLDRLPADKVDIKIKKSKKE